MAEILQGTTPSIEIVIDTDDFSVSDVTALEFTIKHNGAVSIYSLDDVTVDTDANSFIYTFSEAATLALNPDKSLKYQLRFMFSDGSILGTKIMRLQVADLISEDVMET